MNVAEAQHERARLLKFRDDLRQASAALAHAQEIQELRTADLLEVANQLLPCIREFNQTASAHGLEPIDITLDESRLRGVI